MAAIIKVGYYAVETRVRLEARYGAKHVSLYVKVQARSIGEAKDVAFRQVFAAFGARSMPYAKSAKYIGE